MNSLQIITNSPTTMKNNTRRRSRSLSEIFKMINTRNSPRITPRNKGLFSAISEEVKSSEKNAAQETRPGRPADVSSVIDMLFDIQTALKTKNYSGKRTAASALAASNLVSVPVTVEDPTKPIGRNEQEDFCDNLRKMLECAICQDVFTDATEGGCCGQIFCRECIDRWVSERGSCPICRDELSFSMLKPSRHSQRMANEMNINCQWCEEGMKKANLAAHLETCEQAPAPPPAPADVVLRNTILQTARLNLDYLRTYLMAPSQPLAETMPCYIRTRGGNYELFSQDGDVLLATAVRRRQLDMSVTFVIHLASSSLTSGDATSSSSERQIGRVERNFVGSQYTFYASGDGSSSSRSNSRAIEIGAVQYAATFGKTPRQMRVAMPTVSQNPDTLEWTSNTLETTGSNDTMLSQIENPDSSRTLSMVNKPPVWIESLEAYCLDFGGRVAAASVKNFMLVNPDDMEKTLMLFGRTADRNVYAMDFCAPLSPLQAFSIALSSMDSHLVSFD